MNIPTRLKVLIAVILAVGIAGAAWMIATAPSSPEPVARTITALMMLASLAALASTIRSAAIQAVLQADIARMAREYAGYRIRPFDYRITRIPLAGRST